MKVMLKKCLVFLISVMMIVTMMPSLVFADSTIANDNDGEIIVDSDVPEAVIDKTTGDKDVTNSDSKQTKSQEKSSSEEIASNSVENTVLEMKFDNEDQVKQDKKCPYVLVGLKSDKEFSENVVGFLSVFNDEAIIDSLSKKFDKTYDNVLSMDLELYNGDIVKKEGCITLFFIEFSLYL